MDVTGYIQDNKLTIIVRPGAHNNHIRGWDEHRKALRVDIAAPPEKGKANKEVISYLSDITGKRVRILRGLASRKKVLTFD